MNKQLLSLLVFLFTLLSHRMIAQVFSELKTFNATPLHYSACAMGDVDQDGDMDVVFTGSGSTEVTIYLNKGAMTFVKDTLNHIIGAEFGDIELLDYDLDGDLDIVLDGRRFTRFFSTTYNIYQNDGKGYFTAQNTININAGELLDFDWGDSDQDGDLDVISNGQLFINNGDHTFEEKSTLIKSMDNGSVDWGDYDHDGDLDVLLTGNNGWPSYSFSKIYINQGSNVFQVDSVNNLANIRLGFAKWADFNNDGWLDILLVGHDNVAGKNIAKIYQQQGQRFEELISFNLTGLDGSVGDIGDYDGDGWLDFALLGTVQEQSRTIIFKNLGNGSFTEQTQENIIGAPRGDLKFGDIDSDGDLDLMLTGGITSSYCKIYVNNSLPKNSPPQPPSGLKATLANHSVTLQWQPAHDDQTPSKALGYVVEVIHGLEQRMVSAHPNPRKCIQDTLLILQGLPAGYHRWRVKTVDNGYLTCTFSEPDSFYIGDAIPIIDHSPKNFLIEKSNGEISLLIKNTGKGKLNWTATTIGNWFTLSTHSGLDSTLVKVTYVKNTASIRKGKIILHSSNALAKEYEIELIQKGEAIFSEVKDHGIPGVTTSASAWGDYDNDGDLDVLVSGNRTNYYNISDYYIQLWRNDKTAFTPIPIPGLKPVMYGDMQWFDYDNNGQLDLILSGQSYEKEYADKSITEIYINQNYKAFQKLEPGLEGLYFSSLKTGDVNNDGRNDIMISGTYGNGSYQNQLYLNGPDSLRLDKSFLPSKLSYSHINLIDYDQDGDLDGFGSYLGLLENKDGVFTIDSTYQFPSGFASSWQDLNADGLPDLFIDGNVILNQGKGQFRRLNKEGIPSGIRTHAWGDYDNDGDLDLLAQFSSFAGEVILFDNQSNGTFKVNTTEHFLVSQASTINFVDYDQDGRLDVFITGFDKNGNPLTKLFHNNNALPNTAPEPPILMYDSISLNTAHVSWDAGKDKETPQQGLSYNLEVHRENGNRIILPEADLKSGTLKTVKMGNVQSTRYWKIHFEQPGTYKWKVQSIDTGFKGSKFSVEKSFTMSPQLKLLSNSDTLFRAESSYSVRWESAFVDTVWIELKSPTRTIPLTKTVAKPGIYHWAIPFDMMPGSYYLKISDSKYGIADSAKIFITPGLKIVRPSDPIRISADSLLKLEWKSAHCDSVKLDYSRDQGRTWSSIERSLVNTNQYNWRISKLEPSRYHLRVLNVEYPSSYDSISFEVLASPVVLAVDENKANELLVHPNPYWESIKLLVPAQLPIENIQIYNSEGRIVFTSIRIQDVEKQLVLLNTGLYIIVFQSKDKFYSRKVIKR